MSELANVKGLSLPNDMDALPAPELITQAVIVIQAQRENNNRMENMLRDMAALVVSLDESNRSLKAYLESRVTVTALQTRTIQDEVAKTAKRICAAKGADYTQAGRIVREALWREFRSEFSVTSPHDLPAGLYDTAIGFVADWTSLAVSRKIAEKGV